MKISKIAGVLGKYMRIQSLNFVCLEDLQSGLSSVSYDYLKGVGVWCSVYPDSYNYQLGSFGEVLAVEHLEWLIHQEQNNKDNSCDGKVDIVGLSEDEAIAKVKAVHAREQELKEVIYPELHRLIGELRQNACFRIFKKCPRCGINLHDNVDWSDNWYDLS